MRKDLKYLMAYLVPASAFGALLMQGWWSFATLILVFGLLPLIESFLPQSVQNIPPEAEESRSNRMFFSLLLYLNIPLVYAAVVTGAQMSQGGHWTATEWVGLVLSVGIVVGANGINVAHELGHRTSKAEQFLAKLLLLPALYQHFFMEHNFGHHKNVATDADPASARKGQHVYHFWWQSILGSWLGAWGIQREQLQRKGAAFWSFSNEMLWFQILQAGWLGCIAWQWGWRGALFAFGAALVGILLLETVNYIEHYGLRRRITESGRPEPVSPAHSWNSDHELGRIFLYELTRHSDHHYKSTRKYQILRHLDQSPQLPYGYPASMLLSLAPPLWFALVDPLLEMPIQAR